MEGKISKFLGHKKPVLKVKKAKIGKKTKTRKSVYLEIAAPYEKTLLQRPPQNGQF
jgi:hypothetical protein